jgi:ketosteroid isomerase-like protein
MFRADDRSMNQPASERRVLLAGILAVLLSACSRGDPERELRSTISAMAQAVERREPDVFLESVADDFTRESGAFGRQEAKRMLAMVYLRNEKVNLTAVVTDVRIDGEGAYVRVRVVATGGAGLLPERGQTWDFDSAWRREGGRWKVYNAEWREGL